MRTVNFPILVSKPKNYFSVLVKNKTFIQIILTIKAQILIHESESLDQNWQI